MPARIKLLTFDLDDTLWPCKPTIMAAEQELYAWMQQHVPQITRQHDSEAIFLKRREFMQQRPDLHYDMSKLRIESLKKLSDEIGIHHDWIDEAFEVFFQARQQLGAGLELRLARRRQPIEVLAQSVGQLLAR